MKKSKPWRPQTHTSSLLITRIRLYTLSLWLDKRGFGIWWSEKLDKRDFGDPKKFNVFIVALVTQKAFMSGPKTWQPWLQHLVTWKQSKFIFGHLKSEDKFQLDMFIKWIYPGIGLAFLFVTCVAVIHTFLILKCYKRGKGSYNIRWEQILDTSLTR